MSITPAVSATQILAGFNDRVVLGLGLTQTIGYGTLYYAYGVVAPAVSAEFGIGIDWFFGAFTIGLLLGGLVAPVVGSALDKRGARVVMSVGSVVAALSLAICALSPNIWVFAATIILCEAAACLVLYEAAFAGLTQIYRHDARRGISVVTLMAGLASTVFWPLTQWMLIHLDWRGTFLVFAALHLLVCAPIHHVVLRAANPRSADRRQASEARLPDPPVLTGEDRRRALVLYTISVVVSGLVFAAFPVHMLRIIENEGFSAQSAAFIAMVMGPAQVLARLVEVMGGHRFDPLMTGKVALSALVASILILLAVPGSLVVAVAFAALYGIAQGLITIARGTVPLQLFGADGYGALVGKITGLRFLANAASPFLFAVAMTHLSVDAALSASFAIAVAALAAFVMLRAPNGAPAGSRG